MTEPPRPTNRRAAPAFLAFLGLAPIAAVAGGLALAPLMALTGILAAPYRSIPGALRRMAPVLAPLAAFLVWGAVTALWSPYATTQPLRTIGGVLIGCLTIAGAAGLPDAHRRTIALAIVASLAALVAVLAVETLFDMPLNRAFNPEPNTGVLARNPAKGISVLVVVVWAGLAAAMSGGARLRLAGLALVAAAAVLSLQFDQNANAIGFACGAVAAAIAAVAPAWAPQGVACAAALWLLLAPLVTPLLTTQTALVAQLPPSWQMRTQIWDYAVQRTFEKPLFGWGVDASRTFQGTGEVDGLPFAISPLHPHSLSLHVWEETGAVGAVLLAGALVAGGWRASRAFAGDRGASIAWCGAIAATLSIWNVSYGAWQEWWVAVAFAGMALAEALQTARPDLKR